MNTGTIQTVRIVETVCEGGTLVTPNSSYPIKFHRSALKNFTSKPAAGQAVRFEYGIDCSEAGRVEPA
jgi:hypothetical protein